MARSTVRGQDVANASASIQEVAKMVGGHRVPRLLPPVAVQPHEVVPPNLADAGEDAVLPSHLPARIQRQAGLQLEVLVLTRHRAHVPHGHPSMRVDRQQIGCVPDATTSPLHRKAQAYRLGHDPGHVATSVYLTE